MKMTLTPTGLKKIRQLKNIQQGAKLQMTRWLSTTERRLKESALSGGILETRTGHLKRNVGSEINERGYLVDGIIGTGVRGTRTVKYARIHEKGGTIEPKIAKALTIPLRKSSWETARVRSIHSYFTKSISVRKSYGLTSIYSAISAISLLPGQQYILSICLLWDAFHTSACSDAPSPITRTFMLT